MWTGPGAARSGRRAAGRRRQGGVVLVLYVLAALTIVGMAGLALDVGVAYLSKTRLHNALDAAALAGAKTLFDTENETTALTAATTLFDNNVTGITGGSGAATVTFSDTLTGTYTSASVATPSTRRYVKVTVTSLPVTTRLIGVLGFSSIPISGTATAGPEGTSGCGGMPLALCGINNGDSDCTDANGCFGITPNPSSPTTPYGEVQINASSGSSWSPGNYGFIDIGSGTSDVRAGMAGGIDTCVKIGTTANVETGSGSGTAKGVNARFEQLSGWASGYRPDLYAPPALVNAIFPASTQSFSAYESDTLVDNAGGLAHRRVAFSPVFDCATMPNGSGTATVIGSACFFLTREVQNDGNIYGQFIDPKKCEVSGGAPTSGSGANGFRTVLYN